MIFLSTVLFLFAGLPQTYKLLRTRSSKDISISTYVCTWIAVFIVLINANAQVFYPNLVSLITLSLNLFLILIFRKL